MDRDYIQLCAEMAYNDTIVESMLNEEVLQEGAITEKIKKLASGFINAIKTLFGKVFEFLTGLINKIKNSAAAKAIKEKINKLKTKHESAFLYESLLSIVLKEEKYDGMYIEVGKKKKVNADNIINYNKVFDHMRNVTDPLIKASYSFQGKLMQAIMDETKRSLEDMELEDFDDKDKEKAIDKLDKRNDNDSLSSDKKIYKKLHDQINRISTWGIKFEYTKFDKENDDTLDKLSSAIEIEYHAAIDYFSESKSIKNIENSLDKGNISDLIPYLYSTGIDKYADQIKKMLIDAKKAFSESINSIQSVSDRINKLLNNWTNNDYEASQFGNMAKEFMNDMYKSISYMEKGCVTAAKVFSDISSKSIAQDHKLLADID